MTRKKKYRDAHTAPMLSPISSEAIVNDLHGDFKGDMKRTYQIVYKIHVPD